MRALYQVALNTIKETIRNHVLYLVLLFVVLLIGLSVSFGDWSVFARIQVIEDFGLATMSLAGLLVAVFIGVGILGKEISSKTVYHILTKPVSRHSFIMGKYAGLLIVLGLAYLIMSLCFLCTLLYLGGAISGLLISAVLCIWVEMAVIIAASLFFSTITSPVLASLFSLGFYCAGHLNDLISLQYLPKDWNLTALIVKFLYYLLPNLEHFNIRDHVVYNYSLPPGYAALVSLYGALYVILFLVCSCAVFKKKDL